MKSANVLVSTPWLILQKETENYVTHWGKNLLKPEADCSFAVSHLVKYKDRVGVMQEMLLLIGIVSSSEL